WPPCSPDLAPVEQAWPRLKSNVYELKPDLSSITSKKEQIKILEEVHPQAWKMIPRGFILAIVDSLPERIATVIKAEGWYTCFQDRNSACRCKHPKRSIEPQNS
ncbi:hypothetical protein K470DRAFT_290053, partial [Piedraia hortae CBS 480.64]